MSGELSHSRATIQYQQEVQAKVDDLYPVLDKNAVEAFLKDDLHHGRFRVRQNPLLGLILNKALKNAGDESRVTFSHHGAEHLVYPEVLELLRENIGKGTLRGTFQRHELELDKNTYRTSRFILESGPHDRVTYRPAPLLKAWELSDDIRVQDREGRQKLLRGVAKDPDLGPGAAILTAAFMGEGYRDILGIFENRNVLKDIQATHLGLHMPHMGSTHTRRAVSDAINEVVAVLQIRSRKGIHPSYRSGDYETALIALRDAKIIRSEDLDSDALRMRASEESVTARAVFVTAHEVAQRNAHPSYRDPARTDWIDRTYGDQPTSKLISAYFVFDR